MREVRKRNWAFVMYPESMPDNWREVITESHIFVALSPLHKDDVDESTGEVKKAHYHGVVCYPGPTSKEVVRQLTDALNCPMPVPLDNVRGAVRYFTHMDNPDKAQYDPKDIQVFNGFDIDTYCELTAGEVNRMLKEVVALIREKGFTEYKALIDYLQDEALDEMFNVASSHTIFVNTYISSARNMAKADLQEVKKTVQDLVSGYSRALRDTNYSEAWEKEIMRIQKMLEEMPF